MQNANVTKDVVSTESQNLASIHLDAIHAPVNFIIEDEVTDQLEDSQEEANLDYQVEVSLEASSEDDLSIVAKTQEEYVSAFKASAEKTARSTLEMCRVVYEASRSLDGFQFREFCKEIGFTDYSSSIRKFCTIGKLYPRFIQYADQLPSTWTNIYLITQIPANHFTEMVKNGQSLATLKGKRLINLLNSTKEIKRIVEPLSYDKKNVGYVFGKMMFTQIPDDTDVRAIQKALNEVSARLPIKFVLSDAMIKIVDRRKEQRYEDAKRFYTKGALRPDMWDLGVEANAVYKTTDDVKQASEVRFAETV